jgi:hypothetical protein
MDEKVHPARPVHHRDAEEMICLVRPDLHLKAVDASADQVAVPDAVGRRNFRELSPAPVRDFHPSASVGAEPVEFQERSKHSATPPLVADQSAVRVPAGRTVPAAKVVSYPDQAHFVVAHRKGAQLVAVMAHRVAALADAVPREQSCPNSPESLAQRELAPERARLASPQ